MTMKDTTGGREVQLVWWSLSRHEGAHTLSLPIDGLVVLL